MKNLAALALCAFAALLSVRGEEAGAPAPALERVRMLPPSLQLIFKFTGGGLVSMTGTNVAGFKIAGADKKFFPAAAKISGETLRLTCDEVKVPVAARFAWGTNSATSLCGKNGRPIAPFRTDDWPDP